MTPAVPKRLILDLVWQVPRLRSFATAGVRTTVLSKHRYLAWQFMYAYNAWVSDGTPPSLITAPQRDDKIVSTPAVVKHL